MIRVDIDQAKLARMLERCGRLARGVAMRAARDACAQKIRELVEHDNSAGVDPYGEAWAPKVDGTPGQPAKRVGGAFTLNLSTNRVTVVPAAPWAAVHQYGATIVPKAAPYLVFQIGGAWVRVHRVTIPARPFMPTTARGAGQWEEPLVLAMRGAFESTLE